jgi:small subunit ribosomal protein S16
MLAIRLQRRGRKGHAQYRLIVQDKARTPTSGRVVFNLGSYDPHSKQVTLNTEKAEYYLSNGAQPSDSAARILKNNGVKLPDWVKSENKGAKSTKNPDKLRKNQPTEEVVAEEAVTEEAPTEEVVAEEAPAEEVKAEVNEEAAPAEEAAATEDEPKA